VPSACAKHYPRAIEAEPKIGDGGAAAVVVSVCGWLYLVDFADCDQYELRE
jgi:hypothetical protein